MFSPSLAANHGLKCEPNPIYISNISSYFEVPYDINPIVSADTSLYYYMADVADNDTKSYWPILIPRF